MFPGILWKSWVFGSLVNNFKADLQAATKETHDLTLTIQTGVSQDCSADSSKVGKNKKFEQTTQL